MEFGVLASLDTEVAWSGVDLSRLGVAIRLSTEARHLQHDSMRHKQHALMLPAATPPAPCALSECSVCNNKDAACRTQALISGAGAPLAVLTLTSVVSGHPLCGWACDAAACWRSA